MQRISRSAMFILCLFLGLSVVGCASARDQLARIEDISEFAALAKSFDARSNHTSRVPVVAANGAKLSVAVHESGPGDLDRINVYLHGVVADSSSWRFLIGGLPNADAIAVDLPGCGMSDAPEASALGEEAYDPTFMARCILQALRTTLQHRAAPMRTVGMNISMVGAVRLERPGPPARITLVGHSLGAMPILRMFGDNALRTEYKDVLDRVDHVVLMNPADVCIGEPSPTIKMLLDLSDAKVGMAECLGLTRELIAQGEMDGVAYKQDALRWLADRDATVLTDAARRHAMQAMIRAAVPGDRVKIDWDAARQWQARYRKMDVPTLIIWGSRDTVLPVSMGYQMQALIPNARLRILDPAKHCLMVEQPQACINLMRDFASGKMETTSIADCAVQPAQRSNSLASNR